MWMVNCVLIINVLKNFLISLVLKVFIFWVFNLLLNEKYGWLLMFIIVWVSVLFMGIYE